MGTDLKVRPYDRDRTISARDRRRCDLKRISKCATSTSAIVAGTLRVSGGAREGWHKRFYGFVMGVQLRELTGLRGAA
jgi:hypothetical protein